MVGQRLRELRMLAGLSQSDLAATIGLTFQQLQKYERGVNRISASKLYMLSRHLAVPVSTFFVDLERPAAGDGPADQGGTRDEGSDDSAAEVPMRSREALILARHFQRIRDPNAKAALKAFAEACAGMVVRRAEDETAYADDQSSPAGQTRGDGKRSRRPRGAVWHPTDINRS